MWSLCERVFGMVMKVVCVSSTRQLFSFCCTPDVVENIFSCFKWNTGGIWIKRPLNELRSTKLYIPLQTHLLESEHAHVWIQTSSEGKFRYSCLFEQPSWADLLILMKLVLFVSVWTLHCVHVWILCVATRLTEWSHGLLWGKLSVSKHGRQQRRVFLPHLANGQWSAANISQSERRSFLFSFPFFPLCSFHLWIIDVE